MPWSDGMPDTIAYISLVILILLSVISVYTLLQVKKLRTSASAETEKQLSEILTLIRQNYGSNAEEFERNRRETSKSLEAMTERLDAMTRQNYETLLKLNKDMTDSLNLIRTVGFEQNEKQTRTVEAAIAKMQESNEEKKSEYLRNEKFSEIEKIVGFGKAYKTYLISGDTDSVIFSTKINICRNHQ